MLYGIIYQFTNNVNKKIYIGQTKNSLEERKRAHLHDSMVRNSQSYFHRAIRKYGIENFDCKILCECEDRFILNIMETYKIMVNHSHVSENGYNLTWGGEDNPMNNSEIREKSSQSLLVSMKNFVGDKNVMKRDDVKEKHQKAIDKLVKTDKWIEINNKCNDEQKGEYEITNPTGDVFIIVGLNKFCKEYGLSQSKMSMVVSGARYHHQGYKCRLIKHNKKGGHIKRIGHKSYTIISPSGDIIVTTNLMLFCEEHKLQYNSMLAVYAGRQKQHKGFMMKKLL